MSSLLTFSYSNFRKLTEKLVNQLDLFECPNCYGRQEFAMRKLLFITRTIFIFVYNRIEWQYLTDFFRKKLGFQLSVLRELWTIFTWKLCQKLCRNCWRRKRLLQSIFFLPFSSVFLYYGITLTVLIRRP